MDYIIVSFLAYPLNSETFNSIFFPQGILLGNYLQDHVDDSEQRLFLLQILYSVSYTHLTLPTTPYV